MGFHPRVFSALGSDLVTNDLVAITELVKNSYDAFASNVEVGFGSDEEGDYIEILDDGNGMSRKILREVWCVVATPYREETPKVRKGRRTRRATGRKGLGRLSAARLGDRLELITKSAEQACWKVEADWEAISRATRIEDCSVAISRYRGELPFEDTGTRLRIFDLRSEWDDERLDELMEHLARLIPPFDVENVDSCSAFSIQLTRSDEDSEPVEIERPEFLNDPKYKIEGTVDRRGTIEWEYAYTPIGDDEERRCAEGERSWQEQLEDRTISTKLKSIGRPECGPFSFEIRAWDIDVESISDIATTYEIRKQSIRAAIKAHKGISLYRDGVLVLPKSESARDWLGFDRRRISDVGKRLGTTQMVGFVSISADGNPRIEDTSDRERLVGGIEVQSFEHMIRHIVVVLENERQKDRLEKASAGSQIKDLFSAVSGKQLVEDVKEVADAGEPAAKTVPIVKKFQKELDKTRDEIERRFVYYSRLASVGTIAELLVHEVRNRTTTIGSFLRTIASYTDEYGVPEEITTKLERAKVSVASLDRLAKTFAPLASRRYRRGQRTCKLVGQVGEILDLKNADLKRHKIVMEKVPTRDTVLAIDPGELSAVLFNLIDNAIYWLSRPGVRDRRMAIRTRLLSRLGRVELRVDDSGPGVSEEDQERIFWPGVTAKPDGIGMGLTVAGEIVAAYGGELQLVHPGFLGGATFQFDIPAAN